MDTAAIQSTLCAFISKDLLGGMAVAADDELLLTDLVDSLGVMRLVAFMEETWNISVPPEDVVLETMQSVQAMSTYLTTQHGIGA